MVTMAIRDYKKCDFCSQSVEGDRAEYVKTKDDGFRRVHKTCAEQIRQRDESVREHIVSALQMADNRG
jgi:hypothetical protein